MMKRMMAKTGTTKCELLRSIRRKVCELNGLEFTDRECPYADKYCKGTCPACDAELGRINLQLEEKRRRGEPVYYDGLKELYIKGLV